MSISSRLYQRIRSEVPLAERNPVRGQWFNIRLQPDLFAGEQLNVGVAFVDHGGTVHTRITDDLSRLQCLYDSRVDLDEMGFIVDMVSALYDRAHIDDIHAKPCSPQIILGEPAYAAGASIQAILTDFFEETVSLRASSGADAVRKPRFQSSSNEAVREELFAWMKLNHAELARRIIPASPHFKVRTSLHNLNQEHSVELHLRAPGKAAGCIVSANCKTPHTAELRILQAAINLNTAIRHLEGERCGLFILRPDKSSGLPSHILARFDDLIDESVWKLRDAGVFVGVESEIPRLGQEVVTWAA